MVQKNRFVYGLGVGIQVDAENGGTATVCKNTVDSMAGDSYILVENAAGPRVLKNVFKNAYIGDSYDHVIDLQSCDDALVSGNKILTMNYSIERGINVAGERATVTKNCIENVNGYYYDLYCIYVQGNDAAISRNKIRICGAGEESDTYAIYVSGNTASVTRNAINDIAGGGDEIFGVYIDGDDGSIDGNRISHLNEEYTYAIYYTGHRARIVKNRIAHVMADGDIYVRGDDFLIENNTVRDGAYYCTGIYTRGSATMLGAAVIQRNSLSFLGSDGIDHGGNGVVIRDNKLNHLAGFGVIADGNDNVLIGNSVSGTYTAAFHIDGNDNSVTGCAARDSDGDGFRIQGNNNTLENCTASNCAAEGLDNSGTDTSAMNCRFTGSRIDYAGNNNMIDDTGTTFGTGSAATAPEIN